MLVDVDELVLAHALTFLDYASHAALTLTGRATGALTAPARQQLLHRSFVRVPLATAATPPTGTASAFDDDESGVEQDDSTRIDWTRLRALLEQPGVSKLSLRCSNSGTTWFDRLAERLSSSVANKITSVRIKLSILSVSAPTFHGTPPSSARALLAALYPPAIRDARALETWRQLAVLLPHLNTIDLSGYPVASIAWLTGFPRLKTLALNVGSFATSSVLAPLRTLASLEDLSLVHVMTPDVAFLDQMPQLKRLAIRERSALRDVSAIRHLRHLQVLSLRYLPAVTDLTCVQELPALRELDVFCVGESAGVTLPSARSGDGSAQTPSLHQLTTLRLQLVTLESLDVLTLCPNLRTFVLHRAETPDLDKLALVPALRTLVLGVDDVDEEQTAGLSPLRALTKLEDLTLYSQRGPVETGALPALPSLEKLSVPSLSDYDSLIAQQPKLSSLTLQQCVQRDIDRVAALAHQLSALSLTHKKPHSTVAPVLDVAPLAALTRLCVLRIAGAMVHDLHPLRALSTLETLELPLSLPTATSTTLESESKELFAALPLLQTVVLTRGSDFGPSTHRHLVRASCGVE